MRYSKNPLWLKVVMKATKKVKEKVVLQKGPINKKHLKT